uniref:SOCS box domain-containing protein n=1 Tax=Poecilia reticulata TaxID=8081 RepID=A0A3P9MXK9_POERE
TKNEDSVNVFMNTFARHGQCSHCSGVNLRVLVCSQGMCVNLNTLDQVSPLHAACQQGHTNCAKLLVENGANVNHTTVDGHTALTEASARGHVTCVSLLLKRGATPPGESGPSSPPIHSAAARGGTTGVSIEALVQCRADVDQDIDSLGSPLHVACSNQQLSSVKKLLQLGADVNKRASGDSPLHIAARLSSPELVSALLHHGVDRLMVNSEGKRPLDLVPPDSPVGRLLRETGESPLKQLCRICIRKTVGKQRLGGIPDLHLPTRLMPYLLYQSEQRDAHKHCNHFHLSIPNSEHFHIQASRGRTCTTWQDNSTRRASR